MKAREPAPLLSTRAMRRAAVLTFATAIALLAVGAAGWFFQRP